MSEYLNITAKRLPTWVLTLLSISIISYVFAMSAVAIMTERNVSFFPPEIGSGPKQEIAKELSLLREEIKLLNTEFKLQIEKINVNLAEARKEGAKTREGHSSNVYLKWDSVATNFENDRKEITDVYIAKLQKLDERILEIQKKLNKHLMI